MNDHEPQIPLDDCATGCDSDEVAEFRTDFKTFQHDLRKFILVHHDYVRQLEEFDAVKSKSAKQLRELSKQLAATNKKFKKIKSGTCISEDVVKIGDKLRENEAMLGRMGETLPGPIDTYLSVVLGPVPLCILSKSEKWNYKCQYERFKLFSSIVISVLCLLLLVLPIFSVPDYLFQLFLVWYYCTLTIRESILVVNGSRIRRWWRFHHFMACVNNAIILMWPHTGCYYMFYYQKGVLYRLRALGESRQMDVNLEGVHSWMLRYLGFLIPFLLLAYLIQLAFGIWLIDLTVHNSVCNSEWHPKALATLMLLFFTGNVLTAGWVLIGKFRQHLAEFECYIRERYEQQLWSFLAFLDASKREKHKHLCRTTNGSDSDDFSDSAALDGTSRSIPVNTHSFARKHV